MRVSRSACLICTLSLRAPEPRWKSAAKSGTWSMVEAVPGPVGEGERKRRISPGLRPLPSGASWSMASSRKRPSGADGSRVRAVSSTREEPSVLAPVTASERSGKGPGAAGDGTPSLPRAASPW